MRQDGDSTLKSSIQLAILYFPLFSLSRFIESVCPFLNIYIQTIIGAMLCLCVLFSNDAKTALKKLRCSIPFTLVFWFILGATKFDVRLTNKLFPGYGNVLAGGGFAFVIELGFFTIAQGFASLLAIVCSNPLNGAKHPKLRSVVQDTIIPAICMIILFILTYLELTMPIWKPYID